MGVVVLSVIVVLSATALGSATKGIASTGTGPGNASDPGILQRLPKYHSLSQCLYDTRTVNFASLCKIPGSEALPGPVPVEAIPLVADPSAVADNTTITDNTT